MTMQQWRNPTNGDISTVDPDGIMPGYLERQGWARVVTEAEATEPIPASAPRQQVPGPRGRAHDEDLKTLGLSREGTADEKRQRLADYVTEHADDASGSYVEPDVTPDPVTGNPVGDDTQPETADDSKEI